MDPALNDTLLPATDRLKRRFTDLLQKIPTKEFANYTIAFPVAFELLTRVHVNNNATTRCNKAIMIISDTAPELFEVNGNFIEAVHRGIISIQETDIINKATYCTEK